MDRRRFLLTSVAGALARPLPARAQAGKGYRIGWLSGLSAAADARFSQAFSEGLRDFGWIEGKNILVERRYADGRFERLPDLAAELVQLKVDIIVAAGSNQIVHPAKQATSTIPIVMVIAVDPVGQGLVANLRHPGGNITGLAWDQAPEITGKYPEFLKETVPGLSRIGGIIDPGLKGIHVYRKSAEDAALKLGLTFHHAEVRALHDFEEAFVSVTRRAVQAVFVYGSVLFFQHLRQIVALAAKHRLPDMYIYGEAVAMNGLMSYGVSFVDLFRRAPAHVDKILKGAKPGDLPVELPIKYELAINLKTAKALGLTIPPSVLARADQVIDP